MARSEGPSPPGDDGVDGSLGVPAGRRTHHWSSPLTRRLVVAMVLLSVLPLMVCLAIGYYQARVVLKRQVFAHMESLASAKSMTVQYGLEERLRDATALSLRPGVRQRTAAALAGQDPAVALGARYGLETDLRLILKTYGDYGAAALIARGNGNVLASAGRLSPAALSHIAGEAVRRPLPTVGRPRLSAVYLDPGERRPALDVVAAVPDAAGEGPEAPTIALLVLQVQLAHGLFPIVDDRTGLGRTGEVVLVDESGLVVKELMHDPSGLLTRRISALPAYRAARGETGVVEARDYRGVRVLAAHRHVQPPGWGLVVKVDRREAYKPLARLAWGFIALAFCIAALAATVAYWLAQETAQPVVELAAAAERLASGDLTARVAPRGRDEIGTLSAGFNRMAEEVASARGRLEGLVGERTRELRESQRRLELALDAAELAIWETMPQTGEARFSDQWWAMLGRVPDELPSHIDTLWSLVHPDDRPRAEDAARAHLEGRRPMYEAELRMRHKSGEWRWVAARGQVAEWDEEGRPLRMLGGSIDITAHKALEERSARSSRLESIGTLAGGVAHDFNNLLTGIGGFADMALGAVQDRPAVADDLRQVLELGRRAAGLTRQLLAFSRRQTLEPVVLNVNQLVEEMAKMLTRLIGERVRLTFVPDPKLGNTYADPAQVEQVVMNLAVNARDAMPDGGALTIETQNVELSREYAEAHEEVADGPYVMIAVTDTGYGMHEETLARIFEPFFTTKGPGQGTGLGLSVVHGIVKQHGGHITCYSEPGTGTTFKVYLPRVDAEAIEALDTPAGGIRARGEERVLLVEDEEHVRRVAQRMLETHGYSVLPCAGTKEAEALFEAEGGRIDLLLTDVVMPDGSGKELYLRLRERSPELPVLYMSGYTVNSIAHHGVLEAGTHFVQKPFTPESLARKVREALGGDAERDA